MLLGVILLFVFALACELPFVDSAEYPAPIQFIEEPKNVQFSNKKSGYLYCRAKATSSYSNSYNIIITWRYSNGSIVKNISNTILDLSNGTLWFPPFQNLVPRVHQGKFQCVAKLSLQDHAILSRIAVVNGIILKPFKVTVQDQYVIGTGGTAIFTCSYPKEVSAYVKLKRWWINKEIVKLSEHLIINDIQNSHTDDLYYCMVENVLTGEIIASNVAKLFIRKASGLSSIPLQFSIQPQNRTSLAGNKILLECLTARKNVDYIWKHNNTDIKFDHRIFQVAGRSLRISNTSLADIGKYTCVVQDKNNHELISASSYLLIRVPLAFRAGPVKIATSHNFNVTFQCEVNGYPHPTIRWYKDAKEITNNNKTVRKGKSLIITTVWVKDEGIYQCTANNGIEMIHQAASLIVGARPPMIIKPFGKKVLGQHAIINISCGAIGDRKPTVSWYHDGKLIDKALDSRVGLKQDHDRWILLIKSLTAADSGVYRCEAKSLGGMNFSEAEILIEGPAKITYVSDSITSLSERNVNITCRAKGHPTPKITWLDKNDNPLPNKHHQSVSSVGGESILTIERVQKRRDAGNYKCKATNGKGLPDYRNAKLNVFSKPDRKDEVIVKEEGENEEGLLCKQGNGSKWTKDGKSVEKPPRIVTYKLGFTAMLTIMDITANDAGTYCCSKTTDAGVYKELTEIVVISRPRFTKAHKQIYNVLERGNIQMLCPASGFPTPRVEWKRKSKGRFEPLPDSSKFHATLNGSLTILNVTKNDETDYSCIAFNSKKTQESRTSKLNVNVPANIINWLTISSGDARNTTSLYCNAKGNQKLTFTWLKNNQEINNDRVTVINNPTSSNLMIKGTVSKDSGNYTCKVKNTFGKDERTARLIIRDKPLPPVVQTQNVTKTSITIVWHVKFNGNSPIISYRISFKQSSKTWNETNITVRGNQTLYMITQLQPCTTYHIRVQARNRLGLSDASEVIPVKTDEDAPYAPPSSIKITPGDKSFTIEWEPLSQDSSNGVIQGYVIRYRKLPSEDKDIIKSNFSKKEIKAIHGTKATLSHLKVYTIYEIKLQAFTKAGYGPISGSIIKRTKEGVPSKPPRNIGIKVINSTAISLFWDPPPKDSINGKLVGYYVRYQDVDGNKLSIFIGVKTRIILRNLHKYTQYSVKLAARTNQGFGRTSTAKKVVTKQDFPGPPYDLKATATSATSIKLGWEEPKNPNGIINAYNIYYVQLVQNISSYITVVGTKTYHEFENITENRTYYFWMTAKTEIGEGASTPIVNQSTSGAFFVPPTNEVKVNEDVQNRASSKMFYKDSAVLGTLIGVCLFIVIVIVVLVLLTKLGFNPGTKLVQRSVNTWRWLVAKTNSSENRRRHRTSGGSSTDGHLGGSSSSLSQPASNNGSQFSIPRTSSGRATESGYLTNFSIPLPFGNYAPGSNDCGSVSGSSDEGIGHETRGDTNENHIQSVIPLRSSNGTPAPLTLMMSPRVYNSPEVVEKEATSSSKRPQGINNKRNVAQNKGRTSAKIQEDNLDEIGKLANIQYSAPLNTSPRRPKYEDGHFIIGPDIDHILAYRPPRCYDSTSSEYSSSRDELAQAYEFGMLHHLDDFYGRPTLESASSSGETASSDRDGICHFTTELSVGRPFLIPVAILPPPPNQRLRTRDRNRNMQAAPLKTYYEKDETLV